MRFPGGITTLYSYTLTDTSFVRRCFGALARGHGGLLQLGTTSQDRGMDVAVDHSDHSIVVVGTSSEGQDWNNGFSSTFRENEDNFQDRTNDYHVYCQCSPGDSTFAHPLPLAATWRLSPRRGGVVLVPDWVPSDLYK